jgi:hypothetical protein
MRPRDDGWRLPNCSQHRLAKGQASIVKPTGRPAKSELVAAAAASEEVPNSRIDPVRDAKPVTGGKKLS